MVFKLRPQLPLTAVLLVSLGACGAPSPPDSPPASTTKTPDPAPVLAREQPSESTTVGDQPAPQTPTAPSVSAPEAVGRGEESRTMDVIQKIVRDNRKPVRICYDRLRREHSEIGEGELTISFVLTPDGKVRKAELNEQRSTLRDPALVKCAIDVIQGLDFPRSSRGMDTHVSYPYVFKP